MKYEMTKFIKAAFFGVIAILNAATSYLFFTELFVIGGGLVSSNVSGLVNGLLGVLVLDVAAYSWLRIYLKSADNNSLRAIAAVGAIVSAIVSAAVSLLYLIMIAAIGFDFPPSWTTYSQIGIALVIVMHFGLVFASLYMTTDSKIAERVAAMKGDATDEMLNQAEAEFAVLAPQLGAQLSADLLADVQRDILAARTGTELAATAVRPNLERTHLTGHGPDAAIVPAPPMNGHTPEVIINRETEPTETVFKDLEEGE